MIVLSEFQNFIVNKIKYLNYQYRKINSRTLSKKINVTVQHFRKKKKEKKRNVYCTPEKCEMRRGLFLKMGPNFYIPKPK